ncbi:MAG: hypothetical protein B6D53_00400 [Candidatus Omnitrophica bacterium 4484_49]|nr:hypothetical protein [Candidatus Omnitrophota bacterium]OQX84180.1 MAG: hypothetical protein B6D53_00400 [Candidatus Omnitrophica bacterium 4484_49]
MKKYISFTLLCLLVVINTGAQPVNIGMSKSDVKKILGEPDLVTTREDLQMLISPKPVDMNRYEFKYEFWIYYRLPKDRKYWGYVDFDKEGKVSDYLIHSAGEKVQYLSRTKVPELDVYKKIGKFTGEDWNLMPDKSKLLLVVDIIDNFRTKGVILRKSPLYYLEELDSFFKDPGHSKFTVINTLYCFAVLNKDWDDGCDQNARIRKLLPSDLWEEFTK